MGGRSGLGDGAAKPSENKKKAKRAHTPHLFCHTLEPPVGFLAHHEFNKLNPESTKEFYKHQVNTRSWKSRGT